MSSAPQIIHFIGSASGIAAQLPGCADGPQVLKDSAIFATALRQAQIRWQWDALLQAAPAITKLAAVSQHCLQLATRVAALAAAQQQFIVFGGDHSSAIGTWSGAAAAMQERGEVGLIWIDAHMDSHTPETSLSGNIHGMPLACLMGAGFSELTQLLTATAKIKPANLCLIGTRSFESGEADYLQQLQVKIFDMAAIKARGLTAIVREAIALVSANTVAYGLTLDVDSMDPKEAPGTGCHEPDGLSAVDLCAAMRCFAHDPRLLGAEIVEFDPHRDVEQKTEKLVALLTVALLGGN